MDQFSHHNSICKIAIDIFFSPRKIDIVHHFIDLLQFLLVHPLPFRNLIIIQQSPYKYKMIENLKELSLQNQNILQGQPSIKNAHTASHLRIYNNQFVFICMDQCIYVYSILKMAENKAALVNIIQLINLFRECQKEYYQDFITSIFRNAEKQDFSTQIFTKEGDTKSNVLLRIEHIKERISFFNNTRIKVIKFEFNQKGQALIVLADGRAIILQNNRWTGSSFNIINLNSITQGKIKQACFLETGGLCLSTKDKIVVISDLADKSKVITHRINILGLSQLYGVIEKDRIKIYALSSKQIHVFEFKKKLLVSKIIKFEQCIHQSFFCKICIFIVNQFGLVKVDLHSLEKDTVQIFEHPIELAYIDRFGNYIPKSISNCKESIWVMDSTTNGVFIGQTIRKNGNYKEGRLLVFQPNMEYIMLRLVSNAKNGEYINTQDTVFANKTKENKEICQNFSNLFKNSELTYKGIDLSVSQYYAVCMNLLHAFEGKQKQKQKIIERSLQNRYQNMKNSHALQKYEYSQLIVRCCFSGNKITDEQLNHCKRCDLYGIEQLGSKCVVCLNKMCKYE